MKYTTSYREALALAQKTAMLQDPDVFAFGLDVPDFKAIFGSVKGLKDEFGLERCFGTPLSEDAMTGVALGAALMGLRPIHIHIRVDFLLLGMNQIANMISTIRYMSGGKLKAPILIRAIIGKGWGQSCQHSKSLHSIFAHIPGVKVIMPTTIQEAYSLTLQAIQDDNPVISLEHRFLYDVKGELDTQLTVPFEKANILSEGSDASVITTSWMAIEALKAKELLSKYHNVNIEVVNISNITSFDIDTISISAKKTKNVIVADYDWDFCGFSAEISSQIYEKCFGHLSKPIRRLGFAHVPCPTTRPLENEFYTSAIDIIRAVEDALNLPHSDLTQETFYSYENNFKGPF